MSYKVIAQGWTTAAGRGACRDPPGHLLRPPATWGQDLIHEPDIETLPWAEQRRRDDALYRTQIAYLLEHSRFYARKLTEAGFDSAEAIGGLDDIAAPPLGMNLFVITGAVDDLRFETVAAGVLPFLAADLVRLILLVSIPALSLALPELLM